MITFAILLSRKSMCKLMSFKVLNYNFTCFLLIFGIQVICLPLIGQKRPVSKKEIKPVIITPNTPFNDLIGSWVSYNRAAIFAAYCQIKPISNGNALEIHIDKPDGRVAVGLIYTDAMDSRWKFVWVGSDGDKLSSNGVRFYSSSINPNRFVFTGSTMMDGVPALDRFIFEYINKDTVMFNYESSKDEGSSWEVGFVYTFKRNNQ